MWHHDWHFGWMMLFWIVLIMSCGVGMRYLFGGTRGRNGGCGHQGPSTGGDSPESILKRRYAKGEIDREEYETCLADLRQ